MRSQCVDVWGRNLGNDGRGVSEAMSHREEYAEDDVSFNVLHKLETLPNNTGVLLTMVIMLVLDCAKRVNGCVFGNQCFNFI